MVKKKKKKNKKKNPAVNAGDVRDVGSIPGSGKSPVGGHGNLASMALPAWRIPWTEGPGGLQSIGHKVLDTAEVT